MNKSGRAKKQSRHARCNLTLQFPSTNQNAIARRILPMKAAPPSTLKTEAKSAKRRCRFLFCARDCFCSRSHFYHTKRRYADIPQNLYINANHFQYMFCCNFPFTSSSLVGIGMN